MSIVNEADDMLAECCVNKDAGSTDPQVKIRWQRAWRLYGREYRDKRKEYMRYRSRMCEVFGYDEAVQVAEWLHRELVAVVQQANNINEILLSGAVHDQIVPPFTVPACDCEITPWAEHELRRRVRHVNMRYRD